MLEGYFPQDCRFYLREELNKRKQRRPQYSLRAFARDMSISPSFLSEFLNGKQALSRAKVYSIGEKLNLSPDQISHFWDLVELEFSSSTKAKASAKMRVQLRVTNDNTRLDVDRYKVIADWYNLPVLELVTIESLQLSHAQIAKALGIEENLVEECVERLLNLNLIKREQNRYVAVSDATIVGCQGSNQAIRNSHEQTLKKHAELVKVLDVNDRESLSLSFSIKDSDWRALQSELQESVISTITKYADTNDQLNQVVSYTMQSVKLITPKIKEEKGN